MMHFVAKALSFAFILWLLGVEDANGCGGLFNRPNCTGRQDQVDQYDTMSRNAFEVCETDGVEGLTWAEVSNCEDQYCPIIALECPTQQEFDFCDLNGDGILTLEEYEKVTSELDRVFK